MRVLTSRIDDLPVAAYYQGSRITKERESLGDENQTMQSSGKRLLAGRTFQAHTHLPTERATVGTQEAWVVVSGVVDATVLDIDDTPLATLRLTAGDCLVCFRGGHALTVIADTLLYEFKNGPYFGQEQDKRWL